MKAWIARDDDNELYIYKKKPYKEIWLGQWRSNEAFRLFYDFLLPEGTNPQWSDDEPIEVELKIEKV